MPPNDRTVIDVPASEILKNDVSLPLEPALLSPAQRMLREIEGMVIDADSMYDIAGGELARVKGAYKKLETERMDLTRPLDEVKKKIMARFSPALETLAAAEGALKSKMLTYHTEREAKAKAEQERQEAAARAERQRLEAEAAEVERKAQAEAAARRKVEEEAAAAAHAKARAEAQALADAGREKEAALAQERAEIDAIARKEAVDRAEAEARERAEADAQALRETAAVVVAAPSTTMVPRAIGTSVKTTCKARVFDKLALIKHVAATPQFENLLEVNESGLNALARSLKKNLNLPGVEVYEDRGLSSRSA